MEDKDELIKAQNEVIGILFEVIKKLQENIDLQEEGVQLIIKSKDDNLEEGKIRLDEFIVPLGLESGFSCMGILINSQTFTKTSSIWGIKNNTKGTNTNRIVIFKKN